MSLIWESDLRRGITMQLRGGIESLGEDVMVMTLRRHNPPHLGPAIVWYLWLMISTNRFVIFLWDEYGWRGVWEEGCDLFCFHFVLGSNRRSVSDALCLAVQTRWEADFSEMAEPILTVQCLAVIPCGVFVNVICVNHSNDWRATEASSSSDPETFSSFHWLCSTLHNCWLLGCWQNTKIINNPDHQLITTCFQKRFRHCVIICKHLSVFADNQGQKLTLWLTGKCDLFLKKSDGQAYFYQPMCMPSEVHWDLEL